MEGLKYKLSTRGKMNEPSAPLLRTYRYLCRLSYIHRRIEGTRNETKIFHQKKNPNKTARKTNQIVHQVNPTQHKYLTSRWGLGCTGGKLIG